MERLLIALISFFHSFLQEHVFLAKFIIAKYLKQEVSDDFKC